MPTLEIAFGEPPIEYGFRFQVGDRQWPFRSRGDMRNPRSRWQGRDVAPLQIHPLDQAVEKPMEEGDAGPAAPVIAGGRVNHGEAGPRFCLGTQLLRGFV